MTSTTPVNDDNGKKALMRYLLQQVQAQQLDKAQAMQFLQLLQDKPIVADEDIAVVGLACRFPDADNQTAFWQNLCGGKASLKDFPAQRLADLQAVMADDMPLFQGGFLAEVDTFDPEAFGISPQAALHMDPYQRLMLQVLVETIEDAGYQRSDFYNQAVGVYIGNDHTHRLINNYLHFIDMQYRDFQTMTGSWTGLLAGRLSYLLNLRGPAQVIDTSCSSALVAIDAAIKAIRAGDCQQALVGGINLIFLPGKNVVGEVENSQARVCTFDQRASGTVWGEGVAAVLLKPLSAALASGDDIYGVIKGIAVNSDGASNGITAPSARAQQEVLLQCWQRSGVAAEQISYVEAHGTGTQLGDPIEVKALLEAFASQTKRRQFCGLGSVKTNIGHTVGASGLASLIKVLLSMQHRQLPPSLNFDTPNPHIDFSQSPVYVQDKLSDWQGPLPLTAGVSAFGLIGTNAHLLVQQAPASVKTAEPSEANAGPFLMLFSGRNSDLLAQSLSRYRDWLSDKPAVALSSVSFTLAVGRSHHSDRVALVCHDYQELITQLDYVLLALRSRLWANPPAGVWRSTGAADKTQLAQQNRLANQLLTAEPATQADATTTKLAQLASCYLAGAQVKWALLFSNTQARRLHLPSQPLLTERYWFRAPDTAAPQVRKHRLTDLMQETDAADPTALYPLARQSQVLAASNAPVSLAEQVVAHVIADTLGYQQLQLSASFYALGGDSIAGTRIVYMLNAMLGISAELSDLLAADTLADFIATLLSHRGLAEALAQQEQRLSAPVLAAAESAIAPAGLSAAGLQAAAPSAGPIPVQAPAPDYPLSRAQRRMYLQSELNPDSTAYNATALVELAKAPKEGALQQALQTLIERHSSLRSRFFASSTVPPTLHQQICHDLPALPYWQLDLRQDPTPLTSLLQQVVDNKVRPYQLAQAPLWQLGLIYVAGARQFLLLDMHHIITDGASMGILLRELLALLAGETLPPLSLQYHDYAVYDLTQRDTPAYQKAARYWLDKFSAVSNEVCQLETDYPRPALRDFKGACWHDSLSADLSQALRELAMAQRCSLFVLLLSAFRVLLSRLGAGAALSIGTPVSGRTLAQVQPLVGMFVNTLVLHEVVDPAETFCQLLARAKANTLADFDHQQYPYEDLTEAFASQHSVDRNPLFDVCFVLNNQDLALGAADLLQDVRFDSRIAKFDLTLMCRDNQGVLELTFEYATALFNAERIRRLALLWRQLLTELVAKPRVALAQLQLCSAAQQQALLAQQFMQAAEMSLLAAPRSELATTEPAVAESAVSEVAAPSQLRPAISTLFERQVARRPDAIALCYGDVQLSYQALASRVTALALALRQLSLPATMGDNAYQQTQLQRGEPVALWFAPGIEMVVAVLAVLRAGAAYLPLDLANPAGRLQAILADSQSRVVLCHDVDAVTRLQTLLASEPIAIAAPAAGYEAQAAANQEQVQAPSYVLKSLAALTPAAAAKATTGDKANSRGLPTDFLSADLLPTDLLPTDLNGSDLAYLMYTSGTTGTPKGALIRQQSVVRVVCDTNYLDLGPTDVCLLLANYAFDGCVFDLFGALLNGATLVVADKADVLDPQRVAALVQQHQVSSMFATTSLFNLLLDEQAQALSRLRYFIFGGEAASPRHCAAALAWFAPGALINVYGPTEATVLVTAKAIVTQDAKQPVPIGKPVNDTSLYILDSGRALVPFGWTGELYIGGLALAAGYLRRPELTREKFVEHPYQPGELLYRTGDLVRWLPDGDLQFVGRVDQQVKIRGFRLELAEIEAALLALPLVSQAQLMVRQQEQRKILVAAVVLSAQAKADGATDARLVRTLTQALAARLPDYMLPSGYLVLEQLPLTANGKVDQRALAELPLLQDGHDSAETGTLSADNQAQNELEQQLMELWQQLLQVNGLGRHDHFFRLGGDSILAIQLISQLRQLGYQVQVKDLFAEPTVAQFAALLAKHSQAVSVPIQAEQGLLSGDCALLPIQQWFFRQNWPLPGHFNQSFRLYFPKALPIEQLTAALTVLAQRHDMLRVLFSKTAAGDNWQARFLPDSQQTMAPVLELDCRGLMDNASPQADNELAQALDRLQQQFDYQQGPLWRVVQLLLPDGSANLLLAFHHLVIDAVSWRIVAHDLTTLLNQPAPVDITMLGAKTSSYRQWANALAHYPTWFADEQLYWQQLLQSGAAHQRQLPAPLPTSHRLSFTLNPQLTNQLLREAPAGFYTRIDDLLLSALLLALQQTFATTAVLVNLEGHGREAELLQSALGNRRLAGEQLTAEPASAQLDLSQTVGWFTVAYPVLLAYVDADTDVIAQNIIAVKEMLRAVPNKGLGFGSFVAAGQLDVQQPAVSFNYLGQFGGQQSDQLQTTQLQTSQHQFGELLHAPCGLQVANANQSGFLLDINAAVTAEGFWLELQSRLDERRSAQVLNALQQALTQVIETACQQALAGGRKTASDFALTALSNQRLASISQRLAQQQATQPAASSTSKVKRNTIKL